MNMKKIVIFIVMLSTVISLTAQNVGIGTTSPAFKLDVRRIKKVFE